MPASGAPGAQPPTAPRRIRRATIETLPTGKKSQVARPTSCCPLALVEVSADRAASGATVHYFKLAR